MSTTRGVASYYDQLLSRWDDGGVNPASATVWLGREGVSIETSSPARRDSFLQTLSHLVTHGGNAPTTRLLVIFREDDEIPLAPITWNWHSPRVTEAGVTCQYFGGSHSLLFWNATTKTHILVISAATEQLLTRPEFMRVVLQGFLAELSLDSVHGGTLGDGNNGVLITNRGGSGKSSLVAAGVLEGLRTLGDDFLMIDSTLDREQSHELYSIFRTLKLSERSPSWPRYSGSILEKGEDKDLFFLDSIASGAMTPRQKMTAIVIPTVGEKFSVTDIGVDDVIRALAPNSLAMGMHPARTLRALNALAQGIPLYSMVVTPDLRPALDTILDLVDA